MILAVNSQIQRLILIEMKFIVIGDALDLIYDIKVIIGQRIKVEYALKFSYAKEKAYQ